MSSRALNMARETLESIVECVETLESIVEQYVEGGNE